MIYERHGALANILVASSRSRSRLSIDVLKGVLRILENNPHRRFLWNSIINSSWSWPVDEPRLAVEIGDIGGVGRGGRRWGESHE